MIFTDGACTGNPGPGGWASVLAFPNGTIRELGGRDPQTTNNRMELLGTIKALSVLEPGPAIHLYTDSTYVIRGITQWIWGWRKRGWKNAEGKDVLNRELWEELSRQTVRLKPSVIEWKYVRGHTGVPGNERCDVIAVAFAKNQSVRLYEGPLMGYAHAIYDLPPDQGLPDMHSKNKSADKQSYTYLSWHGGEVWRHQTWAECERRVKGQSAAKFKKVKSASEERDVLKGWGLEPGATVIKGK